MTERKPRIHGIAAVAYPSTLELVRDELRAQIVADVPVRTSPIRWRWGSGRFAASVLEDFAGIPPDDPHTAQLLDALKAPGSLIVAVAVDAAP